MRVGQNFKKNVLSILLVFQGSFLAQCQVQEPIQMEHLRINVANKEATAKWYQENLGLEIVSSDYKELIYLADKDHNFMIELSQNLDVKTTYFDVPIDGFHLAFEGHKAIQTIGKKLLENGAIQEGKLYTNLIGDYVLNVRDPNGLTFQLLHRVKPFYSKPVKSVIRFEHFAFNTPDQKVKAMWFVEFMDLKIPWSKDIDTLQNNFRNYRVPYIGDKKGNMSLELFGKADVSMSFSTRSHAECHLAFLSDAPEELADRMVFGGAKRVGPTRKEQNGDLIIDLFDPSNFPIRIIKRKKIILKK